jgi:hypothetical protein
MSRRLSGSPSVAAGVGGVREDAGRERADALDPRQEGRELLAREGGVVVGGREVRHRATRRRSPRATTASATARASSGIAGAEPAHSRVELDVDAGARGQSRDERRLQATTSAPAAAAASRSRRERAEHQQRAAELVQAAGLPRRRDRQPRRAAAQRGFGGCARAVPVAVGLDDDAQPRGSGEAASRAALRSIAPASIRAPRAALRALLRASASRTSTRGDHTGEAPVLGHRQAVVPGIRDHPGGVAHGGGRLDRVGILGHHVARVAAKALRRRVSNRLSGSRKTMPPNSSM